MIRNEHDLLLSDFTIIGEAILNGHEELQFFVGLYENVIPQPILRVSYQPQHEGDIVTSLVRMDHRDDYSLTYHFLNTGDHAYRITIATRWSDADW